MLASKQIEYERQQREAERLRLEQEKAENKRQEAERLRQEQERAENQKREAELQERLKRESSPPGIQTHAPSFLQKTWVMA